MDQSKTGNHAMDNPEKKPQIYLREALILTGVLALSLAAAKFGLFHIVSYCPGFGFAMASTPLTLLLGVVLIAFRWNSPRPEIDDSRSRLFACWMWIVFVTAGVLFSLIKDWNMANQFGAHAIEIMFLAGVFSMGSAISFLLVVLGSSSLWQLINAVLVWLIGILFCVLLLWQVG